MPRKPRATAPAGTQQSGDDVDALLGSAGANQRSRRMRLRAAWMYYVEEMTQNDIAQQLGIGRVTVIRLLSDARERGEIKFTVESGLPECVAVERELERVFGLEEAIVVPLSDRDADATLPVSAALGQYLSEQMRPSLRIGVGWGRTLLESLSFIRETPLDDVTVVSLLGGLTQLHRFNPSEFAWRFANLFGADCYLITAPLLVDSAATRNTLIERCGLDEVFSRAASLDLVVVSVGDISPESTAYRHQFLPETLRADLAANGAVGELLFHYFNAAGEPLNHPIHQRVMTVSPQTLRAVPRRVIASGGQRKTAALYGAIRQLQATTLVTDAHAAAALLALARNNNAR